jgi:hypothetical protein
MDVGDSAIRRGARATTDQNAAVNSLAPLDARTLIYTAPAEDGTGPALWTLDVPAGPRAGQFDLDRYTSGGQSRWEPHGSGHRPSATLWRLPLVIAPSTNATCSRPPCPRCARWRPVRRRPFYLATGGVGDSLWHASEGQTSKSSGVPTCRWRSLPRCHRTDYTSWSW